MSIPMSMPKHSHDLTAFSHEHSFADAQVGQRRQALTLVTLLTLVTMVVELVAGWWSGSLALTADGWHMGTHALALGGAVLAYRLSARAALHRAGVSGSPGYAFGGWKIEVLAAYTSGLALLGVALWLAYEGFTALRAPRAVAYQEAMVVAVIGLVVNLVSAWLLARGTAGQGDGAGEGHPHDHHGHGHDHGHVHGHDHHHDHNFSAAYLHVIADAFTSVLAIAALAGGAFFGWRWLDPAVALLGALVIAQWSWGILRSTARALVDATEDPAIAQRIRELVENDGDARLSDLHVWQVGARAWCAALAVVADDPLPVAAYRARLQSIKELRHATVEVHRCPGCPASPPVAADHTH